MTETARTFADPTSGIVYRMEFDSTEASVTYEPPDDRTEIANAPGPDHKWRDGKWVPPDRAAEALERLRYERNAKLSETDWTQLADSPVDKARWAIYRQQLRDLPSTTPDAAKVTWPKRPDDADPVAAERELDRAARTVLFDGKKP